jgi:hypothetical protein
MAFLGFHSSSVLNDAYRNGWHPDEDDRKPCAKFVDPCGMASFDLSDIVFLSKTCYLELNEFDAITLASANGYFASVTKLISSMQ